MTRERPRPQSDCDPEAEESFAKRALGLLGEDAADDAQDEAALDAAIALHVGQARTGDGMLYIYRAQHPAECLLCGREIRDGELFNSIWGSLPRAQRVAYCEGCRPTAKKRRRA